MKTLKSISVFFVGFFIVNLVSCSGCRDKNLVNPDKSLETVDLLKGKTFKAIQIKEGSTIVYKDNATNNIIPGYSRFRLTLDIDSRPVKIAKLIEYSGEEFNGRWEVVDDGSGKQILRLVALNPVPTNTGGTIEYEIKGNTAETLLMNSLKANPKTGDTINEYNLGKL
jgi:hypothetical protein